jgi:hypothetical protein
VRLAFALGRPDAAAPDEGPGRWARPGAQRAYELGVEAEAAAAGPEAAGAALEDADRVAEPGENMGDDRARDGAPDDADAKQAY